MRFVILIQTNPEVAQLFSGMSDDDRRAAYQVYWDVENDLTESGELVDSKAIDGDAQKYVRRGDDGPVITDADTAEVVTGYYLVDVDDEARAHQIAARFPEAVVARGIRVARVWTQADFDALS